MYDITIDIVVNMLPIKTPNTNSMLYERSIINSATILAICSAVISIVFLSFRLLSLSSIMDELSDPSSSSSFREDGSIISVSASHSAYNV